MQNNCQITMEITMTVITERFMNFWKMHMFRGSVHIVSW